MAPSDFTDAGTLGATTGAGLRGRRTRGGAGEMFGYRLYYFVLAYSGWEHFGVVPHFGW